MLWRLGINPDLASDVQTPMFWVKWGFAASVVAASVALVIRLARPGVGTRRAAQVVALPLVALWGLAAVVLLAAAPAERMPLTLGSSWNTCPFNIAMLSLPALVLLLAAVRSAGADPASMGGCRHRTARRSAWHAGLRPALPGTRGAVPRCLVRARLADPGRRRRAGRPTRPALVAATQTDGECAARKRRRRVRHGIGRPLVRCGVEPLNER